MNAIAVVSGKGGTGKTILSSGIALTLTKRILLENEQNPKVLIVDLDLHVRGISLLMYRDPSDLKEIQITSHNLLNLIPNTISIDSLAQDLKNEVFVISENISVLPSTNLKSSIDWTKIHKWKVLEIIQKLEFLIDAAEKAGYQFIIFDTRAGPDNVSLAASLASDMTLIVLEQDRVSSLISMGLMGEIEYLRNKIAKTEARVPISRIAFLQNKVLKSYSADTERVLMDLTFLPAIPLDLEFLNYYYLDANKFMLSGQILNTKLGQHILKTTIKALDDMRIKFTIIPLKGLKQPKKELEIIKFVRKIPGRFLVALAVTFETFALINFILFQFLPERYSEVLGLVGIIFLAFSIYRYYIEDQKPKNDYFMIDNEESSRETEEETK